MNDRRSDCSRDPLRHAAIAALPLAATLTALAAAWLPIRFSHQPNDLGIVSLATLREYPSQQEPFWTGFCLACGTLLAWALARALRRIDRAPRFGVGLESMGVAALACLLWLPRGSGWPPALAFAAGALVLTWRLSATDERTDSPSTVPLAAPTPISARGRAAWWGAALLLAGVFSSHPTFPDGFWGGVANLAQGLGDLELAGDHPLFHGEWGEHLAWADVVRGGGYQGRDFFCLYGPLFELSLAGTWAVAGRSLAAFTLWQGLLHAAGFLCALALGQQLVRRRLLLFLLPLFVSHVSVRIGLGFLVLAALAQWRHREDPRWCSLAGCIAGVSLFTSQEFGIAAIIVATLAMAVAFEWRPAAAFGLGLLVPISIIAAWFAAHGALTPMLADLAAYPGYVAAGYANLPVAAFFEKLPIQLLATSSTWDLELRLTYALPAIALGGLLLCLPLEDLDPRRPAQALARARAHLLSNPHRFALFATAAFGILCFRVGLGRTDLQHLTDVMAPAALMVVAALDRVVSLFRRGGEQRALALWRAALLTLLVLQSGLVAAAQPGAAIQRTKSSASRWLTDAPHPGPEPRVAWLTSWLSERTQPGDAIFLLPNLASYYYLSERPNPTRFALSGMIVTNAHRDEVLRDLGRRPPRFIVRDSRGMRIDGLSDDVVLGPAVLRFIDEEYAPVAEEQGFQILQRRAGASEARTTAPGSRPGLPRPPNPLQ